MQHTTVKLKSMIIGVPHGTIEDQFFIFRIVFFFLAKKCCINFHETILIRWNILKSLKYLYEPLLNLCGTPLNTCSMNDFDLSTYKQLDLRL